MYIYRGGVFRNMIKLEDPRGKIWAVGSVLFHMWNFIRQDLGRWISFVPHVELHSKLLFHMWNIVIKCSTCGTSLYIDVPHVELN